MGRVAPPQLSRQAFPLQVVLPLLVFAVIFHNPLENKVLAKGYIAALKDKTNYTTV